MIVDADLDQSGGAEDVLRAFRARNDRAPAFLFGERSHISAIPLSTLKLANEFIWLTEDTPTLMAGRVEAAIQRYRDNLLPPMFSSMLAQANVHEYAFGTPGHLGGTAFLKTPVSKIFFDYFGENLLRSDLSIGMAAVGSLLDHSGPIGESEKYAARVFGAHRSYTVTNGTSGSNRIIFMASLTQNDIALCDRNCHKSIEHGLVMTGAIPVFLVPHRNRYGIIGPIYPEDLQPETVRKRASANPLTAGANRFKPQHTIITNSTYDGLIYNVERVIEIGGDVIDRLHFDEAWYAYARFNPTLPRPLCHVRRPCRLQERADIVRDTFDPQTARGALASLVHPHSRRAGPHRACSFQRVVHDACVDLAVLSDHRLQRDFRRHDGRRERGRIDHRVHSRGREFSPDGRAHQAAVCAGQ